MLGKITSELRSRRILSVVSGLHLGCKAVFSAHLVLMLTLVSAVGQSDLQNATTPEARLRFDIPEQPLTTALDAYAAATGLEVLYDSNLAAGRRSTIVRGVLVPDVALRVLLEGTGLTVLYAEHAFAVVPRPSRLQSNSTNPTDRIPYLAIVQGSVERVFCNHPETRPGQYRLALRFSIGAGGEVLQPQLLSSTGDPQRDGLIADLLSGLSIERAPPPDLPQPITMIVSPRPPVQTGDCGSAEGRPLPRVAR
jgi:hypothetical protein